MDASAASSSQDNIKLICALIAAFVSVFVAGLKVLWDIVSKRDERTFKKQFAAGNISLEGQVKLIVDAQLKGHDARLRIAAEWRIKMLDKLLEAGGELRMRLNGVLAAINELTREATLRGADPKGRTQALVDKVDEAIRKVSRSGGYLPPDLIVRARELLERIEVVVFEVVKWSELTTEDERNAACDKTIEDMRSVAKDISTIFGQWHQAMWDLQEERLTTTGDPGAAEALRRLPSPYDVKILKL